MNIILTNEQIERIVKRIAFQVLEDNLHAEKIFFAGISTTGYKFAERLIEAFKQVSQIPIHLLEIKINKQQQATQPVQVNADLSLVKDEVVFIIDDVLNSGKTLTYAMLPFLNADAKKVRTILLVDRDHRNYPVHADFVGIRLATTLQQHIAVCLDRGNENVILS